MQIQALTGAANVTTATVTGSLLVLPKPSGLLDGHLMVALLNHQNTGGTWGTVPAGWQEVSTFTTTRTNGAWVKPVSAASAETSADYTWATSGTGSGRMGGMIFLVQGASLASPVGGVGAWVNNGTSTITAPSVSSPVAGSLLVGMYISFIGSAPNSVSPPATMTSLGSWQIGTTSSSTGMNCFQVLGDAGDTGSRVATASPAGSGAIAMLFTINPTNPPLKGWGVHL